MSLKSAIREAVDARDNSQPQPEAKPETRPKAKARHNAEVEVTQGINTDDLQINSKAINTASHKAVQQVEPPQAEPFQPGPSQVEMAALTVRVSRRHRLHWLIAAKRQGTSLTAAITEALNARFGEPDE